MTLAPYVRILGRGPGRSRSLTLAEAQEAMTLMLSGQAAPEAVGALLMLLRMKGETAAEIAGFASAAQEACPALPAADLDWPCYAAGRTRGLPLFLLSARLVARAGHRVVLHGWNGPSALVRDGLAALEIPTGTPEAALSYHPLEDLHPALFDLLALREVLGLRSCVNTVCRMLNPARARASVQGVFHPSYRLLQRDAAQIMGLRHQSVIKGGGGEFERNPAKGIEVFGLADGTPFDHVLPALRPDDTRRMDDGARDAAQLAALWTGALHDPFAVSVVLGTASLALATLGHTSPDALTHNLWTNRLTAPVA